MAVAASPNAYLVALIAVLGAVVGAAISAITQFFTARRSSANQLTALELSLKHATHEGLRQERRRVYTRFLLAMEQWDRLCIEVYEAKKKSRKIPDYHSALKEYRAAHTELKLLAGKDLAMRAQDGFSQNLEMMRRARKGKKPDEHPNLVLPTVLTAAMQSEMNAIVSILMDHKKARRSRPEP